MLEFFTNVNMSEIRLVRFIERRLNCGMMQRDFGMDEMVWSRGMFALLDLDPDKDKPSFTLLQNMKHPEDRLTFAQAESAYEAATTVSRKFRVIRRDGTLRVLSQHAEVIFDSGGKADKLISIVEDVTDQETIRDQLNAIEWRFAALIRHSGFMLNLLRKDGFVTRIFADNTSDEDEQSKRFGFQWHNLIHPEEREESIEILEKGAKELLPVTREHRVLQSDGSYRWRRAIWAPVFNDRHELKEYIAISQDIEKEKNIVSLKDKSKPITGAQVRMARALARWSVHELACAANVSASAIRRIEEFDGAATGGAEIIASIRSALCGAGVEFIFPPTGRPGVRPA